MILIVGDYGLASYGASEVNSGGRIWLLVDDLVVEK